MSVFPSKKAAKLFVCQASVDQKKPFVLDKSEPGRIVVTCPKQSCNFKMVFRGNQEGVYVLVEDRKHACISALPTIKRVWIRQLANYLRRDRKVTPAVLKEYIETTYDLSIDVNILKIFKP